MRRTVTVRRPDQDITVVLSSRRGPYEVADAIDEDGRPTVLTPEERAWAIAAATLGHDETGR